MTNTIENKPAPKRQRRMAREPKPVAVAEVSTSTSTPTVDPKPARPASKSTLVLELLQRPEEGATLDQLVKATGWQKHTVRASLTGLKKKGHAIERSAIEGTSRYAIDVEASQ